MLESEAVKLPDLDAQGHIESSNSNRVLANSTKNEKEVVWQPKDNFEGIKWLRKAIRNIWENKAKSKVLSFILKDLESGRLLTGDNGGSKMMLTGILY